MKKGCSNLTEYAGGDKHDQRPQIERNKLVECETRRETSFHLDDKREQHEANGNLDVVK